MTEQEKVKHREEIAHNLRVYEGSNITVIKTDGYYEYGKLLSVEYDEQKIEFYALMFYDKTAFRIYESEIEQIIPAYWDMNDSIINSVRTILAEDYILWDSGVITSKHSKFPVVNIVNEGSTI